MMKRDEFSLVDKIHFVADHCSNLRKRSVVIALVTMLGGSLAVE